MKYRISLIVFFILFQQVSSAQQKGYTPKIEPCECAFKADTGLKTRCAYLIVPESRNKPNSKTIKLPFIYVESKNPNKHKDPVLYTGGGPGGSSLSSVRNTHRRSLIKDRDYIAFEQRGTQYALPCLKCDEIAEAVKKGYHNNLPIDSMVLDGVKRCRKNLLAQGIDLSAYNTDESADDIEDLRTALKIDSLNLMGISYSGGLMMAVLQKYPQHIRSLVLDSPLPEFINIDEQELTNFNEALKQVFKNCETDSLDKTKYGNLEERFHQYFTSIGGKAFYIKYAEKGSKDTLNIKYGRNELLGILHGAIENYPRIKYVPSIITELIRGNQQAYIKSYLDDVFAGYGGPSGMRISVYCSDKMAYADKRLIYQQEQIQPYMARFHVNDVYLDLCNCWQVPAIKATTKKPFYSNAPALLGAADIDDACRPVYNDMIHHYMPNSQRLLFIGRPHAPMLNSREGDVFIGAFLNNPHRQLTSADKAIIVY